MDYELWTMDYELIPQLPHYLADFLHRGKLGGNEREAQDILNKPHLAEHRLHTSWIAIDKEQLEEFSELVVVDVNNFCNIEETVHDLPAPEFPNIEK